MDGEDLMMMSRAEIVLFFMFLIISMIMNNVYTYCIIMPLCTVSVVRIASSSYNYYTRSILLQP